MRIVFLFFLFGIWLCSFSVFADRPSLDASGDEAIISDQDMEKMIKAHEIILRKIKDRHMDEQRKEHLKAADLAYQEGAVSYQYHRMDHARQAFDNVRVLVPYYKSTDAYWKNASIQAAQELKKKAQHLANPSQAIDFQQEAKILYYQVAQLGNDKNSTLVKNKLMETIASLQKMYARAQLDKVARDANTYDDEVFKLVQAGDYRGAEKKYLEFQQAMIKELTKAKQLIAQENE